MIELDPVAIARVRERCGARAFAGYSIDALLADLPARVPPGTASVVAWIDALVVEDLYLALACARGDAGALRAFEAAYVPDLRATVRKRGGDEALAAEVIQTLRTRLFVGPAPKIASYSGRGALRVWLRVVAARIVLELEASAPAAEDDGAIWELPAPGDHVDVEHWKRASRDAFRAAFSESLATLSPRDRTLLAQYHLDGLTLQELGALYKVHTATAGRWIAAARQAVMDRTRARLAARMQLSAGELASLVQAIRSRLDLSLSRLLRKT